MSGVSEARTLVQEVERKLALGAPVDEVLDLVDAAIARASEVRDPAALERLARALEAGAAMRDDARGLTIAAERARLAAASPAPAREPTPPAPSPLPAPAPVSASVPAAAEPLAAPAVVRYAGWWQRTLAIVVDWMAIGTVVAFLPSGADDEVWAIVLLGAPLAYFTGMHAFNRGQTVGKALFGIAVRTYSGDLTGLRDAFVRALVQGMLLVTLVGGLLDALVPLGDERRRSLHDRSARTVVLRVRGPIGRL